MDLSSNIALGTVLVQKSGSRGRFLVTHVVVTSTKTQACLVYAKRENAKGNGWHDFAMLLEDVSTEYEIENDDEAGLDI